MVNSGGLSLFCMLLKRQSRDINSFLFSYGPIQSIKSDFEGITLEFNHQTNYFNLCFVAGT